jgi:hypothetical protein
MKTDKRLGLDNAAAKNCKAYKLKGTSKCPALCPRGAYCYKQGPLKLGKDLSKLFLK